MKPRGELAVVLHTHMPYVEGFGTWPFGEEWLWEAIATSYLPLLDVLGRAPITLSLTPVLGDQLEDPGTAQRSPAVPPGGPARITPSRSRRLRGGGPARAGRRDRPLRGRVRGRGR